MAKVTNLGAGLPAVLLLSVGFAPFFEPKNTMNDNNCQRLFLINSLDIGDKFLVSLATWYAKRDWNKTIYECQRVARYVLGVVVDKHTNKLTKRTKLLINFPVMDEEKPKWFSTDELVSNPLYVISISQLPSNA